MPADKQQLIRHIQAEMSHLFGRRYRINLELLDPLSLRELITLLRDVRHEATVAANRARMMPWRRI